MPQQDVIAWLREKFSKFPDDKSEAWTHTRDKFQLAADAAADKGKFSWNVIAELTRIFGKLPHDFITAENFKHFKTEAQQIIRNLDYDYDPAKQTTTLKIEDKLKIQILFRKYLPIIAKPLFDYDDSGQIKLKEEIWDILKVPEPQRRSIKAKLSEKEIAEAILDGLMIDVLYPSDPVFDAEVAATIAEASVAPDSPSQNEFANKPLSQKFNEFTKYHQHLGAVKFVSGILNTIVENHRGESFNPRAESYSSYSFSTFLNNPDNTHGTPEPFSEITEVSKIGEARSRFFKDNSTDYIEIYFNEDDFLNLKQKYKDLVSNSHFDMVKDDKDSDKPVLKENDRIHKENIRNYFRKNLLTFCFELFETDPETLQIKIKPSIAAHLGINDPSNPKNINAVLIGFITHLFIPVVRPKYPSISKTDTVIMKAAALERYQNIIVSDLSEDSIIPEVLGDFAALAYEQVPYSSYGIKLRNAYDKIYNPEGIYFDKVAAFIGFTGFNEVKNFPSVSAFKNIGINILKAGKMLIDTAVNVVKIAEVIPAVIEKTGDHLLDWAKYRRRKSDSILKSMAAWTIAPVVGAGLKIGGWVAHQAVRTFTSPVTAAKETYSSVRDGCKYVIGGAPGSTRASVGTWVGRFFGAVFGLVRIAIPAIAIAVASIVAAPVMLPILGVKAAAAAKAAANAATIIPTVSAKLGISSGISSAITSTTSTIVAHKGVASLAYAVAPVQIVRGISHVVPKNYKQKPSKIPGEIVFEKSTTDKVALGDGNLGHTPNLSASPAYSEPAKRKANPNSPVALPPETPTTGKDTAAIGALLRATSAPVQPHQPMRPSSRAEIGSNGLPASKEDESNRQKDSAVVAPNGLHVPSALSFLPPPMSSHSAVAESSATPNSAVVGSSAAGRTTPTPPGGLDHSTGQAIRPPSA